MVNKTITSRTREEAQKERISGGGKGRTVTRDFAVDVFLRML